VNWGWDSPKLRTEWRKINFCTWRVGHRYLILFHLHICTFIRNIFKILPKPWFLKTVHKQCKRKKHLKRTQFRVKTCFANKVWKNLIALVIGGCVCKNFFIDANLSRFQWKYLILGCQYLGFSIILKVCVESHLWSLMTWQFSDRCALRHHEMSEMGPLNGFVYKTKNRSFPNAVNSPGIVIYSPHPHPPKLTIFYLTGIS
jgi:hypothetical protein